MGQKKRDRTNWLRYACGRKMAVEKVKSIILERKFDELIRAGIIRRTDNADLRIQV